MADLGYNRALADSTTRMQREARMREWLNVNQKLVNRLWKAVESIDQPYYRPSISTNPAIGSTDPHIVVMSVTLRNLEGLKDPRLEAAMMPFIDADKTTCTDYPQYMNRDYSFIFNAEGGQVQIYLQAYVKEENPTCRKILVERKSVTTLQEVYKLSCDGDIVDAGVVDPKLEAPAPLTIENGG